MKYQNIKLMKLAVLIPLLFILSCKKLVTIDPPITGVSNLTVYNDDASAISAVTGIYANMAKAGSYATGNGSISMLSGLSADEFTLYSGATAGSTAYPYYKNQLAIGNGLVYVSFWPYLYSSIYVCNAAVEGLTASSTLTPAVKKQLLGEVKFTRAFCYLYLVNLFGDVPLPLSPEFRVTERLPRSPKASVYAQIIKDLTDAQGLLADGYTMADGMTLYTPGSEQRVRPCKAAAIALLARAYLFDGNNDYSKAETQATAVINNTTYYGLPTLANAFLQGSSEAIWQLQPIVSGHNTEDAWTFILTGKPSSSHPVYLSPQLLNSFEAGDNRLSSWTRSLTTGGVTYNYPYKYQSATLNAPVTEYLIVLRLAEQYLIRAEARAQQGNIAGAQSDLNIIRARAGLPPTTAATQADLLTAILHERQVELFTEWGHRWIDLKRSGTIDAVMATATPLKANGAPWNSYQQLYPLPATDILYDPNLGQNPGY